MEQSINQKFFPKLKEKLKNKRLIIAIIISAIIILLLLTGSCILRGKNSQRQNTSNTNNRQTTSTAQQTNEENKIENGKIILSDGTIINLSTSTAQNHSQTSTTNSAQSGGGQSSQNSAGQQTSGSGGSTASNASQSSNATGGSAGSNNSSGGTTNNSQTTPAPSLVDGFLWSEKDYSYGDQTVKSPVSNYLLAKFDLVNDTNNDLNIDKTEMAFAFEQNFGAKDLTNVYLKINNKKYAIKSAVSSNGNIWTINETILKHSTLKAEVYGDISSSAGDALAESRVITLIKSQATQKNGTKIYYSGENNQYSYVAGQSIYAKTNVVQTSPPQQTTSTQQTTTPTPQQTTPPQQTTTTVTQEKGYMIIKDARLTAEMPDRAMLINTYRGDLRFGLTAKNEDLKLTKLELLIIDSSSSKSAQQAVMEVQFFVSGSDLVKTKDLGKGTLTGIGSLYKVELAGDNLMEIKKDQTEYINVNVLYYGTSAAGSILKSALTKIEVKGKTSQQIISASNPQLTAIYTGQQTIKGSNESLQAFYSGSSYLVSTYPIIYALQVGDTNLQGGSQKELYRFGLGAISNPSYPVGGLTMNYIDFSLEKTDATVKNAGLYYLNGSNWTKHSDCLPVNQNKWRCGNGNLQIMNAGQTNLAFSLRADLGLKSSASINTSIANVGNLKLNGDAIWTDKIGGQKYYWLEKMYSNENLATKLYGGGNGTLFDATGPKILGIASMKAGTCQQINIGDGIALTFDEDVDPTSVNSIDKTYPEYNYANADGPGRAIICTNSSSSGKSQISYMAVNNIFTYTYPLNNEECKKYATKYQFNGDEMVIFFTDSGTSTNLIPPNNTITIRDMNGNVATASTPAPSGNWLCK